MKKKVRIKEEKRGKNLGGEVEDGMLPSLFGLLFYESVILFSSLRSDKSFILTIALEIV